MVDDITGLESMMASLDAVKFTREEKADVVEAGASIAKHKLQQATKQKMNPNLNKIVMDFKKSKGGRYEYDGHLYDGLIFKKNEFIDGSTNVGFKNGFATIAQWLNNGTYRQPATYFLDRAMKEVQSDSEIAQAQITVAEKIAKKRGV